MLTTDIVQHVDTVRHFNRFYTKQIGVLEEGILQSPFSLTEARVIYELAQQDKTTAKQLRADLKLDAGYLSRILRGLIRRGHLKKAPDENDGRKSWLSLTEAGQQAFQTLNKDSCREIEGFLSGLSVDDRHALAAAMKTIESLLSPQKSDAAPYLLRPHHAGDMGWMIHRHAVLYNREYGWTEEFEALAAEIAAQFIRNYDPKCERCWIAEKDGEKAGGVFLVKKDDRTAQLRMLLVEPNARGLGIGKRLVQECTHFARQVGYDKIMLWTNSILGAARHIYVQEGYQLIEEQSHQSFGADLVGEVWELAL